MNAQLKFNPFFLLAACLLVTELYSQQNALPTVIESLKFRKDQVIQEKLFVDTDRSFYLTGDYLRCMIYCVDASDHRALDLSKIVYVEILDNGNKPVLQSKIQIRNGLGNGTLFLPTTLNTGTYVLRAYTRWMQNFDPGFYFHQTITIVNPFRTADPKDQPLVSQAREVNFFPEGGWMVEGLKSRVAFKINDAYGKGIKASGTVTNAEGAVVVTFESNKLGMGQFELTPRSGEKYKYTLNDSLGKVIAGGVLADAKPAGAVMKLEDKSESLEIVVNVSHAFMTPALSIVGQARGTVHISERKEMVGTSLTFIIPSKNIPDGINQFTVFDSSGNPLAERLYFRIPEKQLTLVPALSAQQFNTRSKVDLSVSGKSEGLELSVSVFRMDSLQGPMEENILTSLLLTSDLAGYVESPGYYFTAGTESREAADNLMMTQGWRRFVWKEVLEKKLPLIEQIPEYRGHTIVGKVKDVRSGMTANGIVAYLSVPGKFFHFKGSRSDIDGVVRFELPDLYGSSRIIVQTDPRTDSVHMVELRDPFSKQFSKINVRPTELSPAMARSLRVRSLGMQMENIYFEKERSRVILPAIDSSAFYKAPDARYFLDNYTRFPTIEDVMREYVPGVFIRRQKKNFHFSVVNSEGKYSFTDDPLILLDGVPIFNVNHIMEFDPLKVQKLEVVTHRYFYGPLTFDGIVSYTTYKGDFRGFQSGTNMTVADYQGVEWVREFYAPRYDTPQQASSRLPDFRNLLMWIPRARTGADGVYHTDFYTSDQAGKYLIKINALSSDGRVGSTSTVFEVKGSGPKP